MEKTELVKHAAHLVQRAWAFYRKAKKDGFLALDAVIDGPQKELRDLFEYGMEFLRDGSRAEVLQGILSGLIAREPDADLRRLKAMQKEAVLCIQADYSGMLLHLLMSHLDADEQALVREACADFFREHSYEGFETPEQEPKEFLEQAACAAAKLAAFSEKARAEGILALDADLETLDSGFLKEGLRMAVDGADQGIIDRVLSRRIALEKDDDKRRLKAMQKEAVLGIQAGMNTSILLPLMLSCLDNAEFEAVRKTHPDLSRSLIYMSVEPVSRKKKEFPEQVAHTVRQALDFSDKAQAEGLSALEEELEDLENGLLKDGLRLALDDAGGDNIYRILSNRIALERDEDARRLKTMQREAVLGIGAGDSRGVLLHVLMSHLDNFELEALRKAHADIFEDSAEKFPCGGHEAPDEEITGFVKRLARVVRRACEFSDKARGEGLASLKEIIDESKAERRDILEYGSQLAADAFESSIDRLLSNLIAHNCDDETRRLKTIQKEAVLGIQAGENTRMLLHTLLSHIDNTELDALRRTFSYAYITEELPCGNDAEPEDEEAENEKGFVRQLARIAQRACEFSGKAQEEGLLALDGLIDEEKLEHRDIFEYGIQFVVDGKSSEVIRKVLSNLTALEQDDDARRLKEIQTEAVLCIHGGLHPLEFLHILFSRATNPELKALQETAPEIFNLYSYAGPDPAGQPMVPETSFWILKGLKDTLEKALGSQKAIEIAGRLTAKLLKDEEADLAEKIKNSVFMFEDILMLEDRDIQKLLREADAQELVTALTGVDAAVQNRICGNLSARAAAILKDRIGHREQAALESGGEAHARAPETFEDIVMLDDKSIQRILPELDAGELGKALRNAEMPVQDKIFKNMSRRAAATLKREIENMTGMVKRKDAEETQERIVSVICRLLDCGEIARPIASGAKEARQKIISIIRHLEDCGEIVIVRYAGQSGG